MTEPPPSTPLPPTRTGPIGILPVSLQSAQQTSEQAFMATKKKSLLLFSGGRARGRESSGSEVWFAFQAPGFLPALVSSRSERACGRQPFPAHLDWLPFVYTSCHPVTWHVGARGGVSLSGSGWGSPLGPVPTFPLLRAQGFSPFAFVPSKARQCEEGGERAREHVLGLRSFDF